MCCPLLLRNLTVALSWTRGQSSFVKASGTVEQYWHKWNNETTRKWVNWNKIWPQGKGNPNEIQVGWSSACDRPNSSKDFGFVFQKSKKWSIHFKVLKIISFKSLFFFMTIFWKGIIGPQDDPSGTLDWSNDPWIRRKTEDHNGLVNDFKVFNLN